MLLQREAQPQAAVFSSKHIRMVSPRSLQAEHQTRLDFLTFMIKRCFRRTDYASALVITTKQESKKGSISEQWPHSANAGASTSVASFSGAHAGELQPGWSCSLLWTVLDLAAIGCWLLTSSVMFQHRMTESSTRVRTAGVIIHHSTISTMEGTCFRRHLCKNEDTHRWSTATTATTGKRCLQTGVTCGFKSMIGRKLTRAPVHLPTWLWRSRTAASGKWLWWRESWTCDLWSWSSAGTREEPRSDPGGSWGGEQLYCQSRFMSRGGLSGAVTLTGWWAAGRSQLGRSGRCKGERPFPPDRDGSHNPAKLKKSHMNMHLCLENFYFCIILPWFSVPWTPGWYMIVPPPARLLWKHMKPH